MRIVTVTIDETDASFSVDLKGFQGKGCDAVIAAFTGDADVTKDVHHPEYNQLKAQPQTVKAGR